jgi:hypothetical protein
MYFSWAEVIPMKRALLASFLALSVGMFAQNIIPAGTVLPVRLSSSLDSHKSKPGQIISAKLMQDVPLAGGTKIRAGARVFGRVIDAVHSQGGRGARIVFRFDTLAFSHRTIPLRTDLRALASMMEGTTPKCQHRGLTAELLRMLGPRFKLGATLSTGEAGRLCMARTSSESQCLTEYWLK